jgi:hypothetical protein
MQDAGAIELSRRGYIVLALDMYEHGHSKNETQYESGSAFFSFWPGSLYDAAQYMYDQDYVLKDTSGNGIIAVAGHSMGGFSATMAMVTDEQSFAASGIRKIHAGLTMGSDYIWAGYLGVTSDVAAQAFGPRVVGKVAAHYDEFFFDTAAEATGNTVIYKDYINTAEGKEFLGYPSSPEEGTLYTLDNGGKRVIYMPSEIHPWNHFSLTTTGYQIQFYTEAFQGFTAESQTKGDLQSGNQIWIFKELFEGVALIGFFLLFIPIISMLLKVPFLSKARTESYGLIEGPKTTGKKTIFWIIMAFAALFPALFFPTLMDKSGTGMTILKVAGLIVAGAAIVLGVIAYVRKGKDSFKTVMIGTLGSLAAGLILFLLVLKADDIFKTNRYFNAPTVNQILYWALIVTAVIIIITLASHYLAKNPSITSCRLYGFVINWKAVVSSLLIAIAAVAIGYVLLFIIDAIFKTDFRIWVWAVKTFEFSHVITCLKYVPLFFLYYFVTAITINANTEFLKGWKGYLMGCIINVGGLVLYLILQYGKLFITQTAFWPAQALSSILLFALVPTLIVATLYTKILYKKTGNVYTGAFLNTILMTMITVANTVVYNGIQ